MGEWEKEDDDGAVTRAQPAGVHDAHAAADVPRADALPALAPRDCPPVRFRRAGAGSADAS
jgi:hypothetical protein